jgi:hypothetical protein
MKNGSKGTVPLHILALMTEGGLDKNSDWKPISRVGMLSLAV